jgi:hypothetical protein
MREVSPGCAVRHGGVCEQLFDRGAWPGAVVLGIKLQVPAPANISVKTAETSAIRVS